MNDAICEMNRDEIKSVVQEFFEAIEGELPAQERIARLELALDRLAVAVHFADYTFDEGDYPDAVTRDYADVREVVTRNFPNLGFYNNALDISDKLAETSLAMGDSIDDICDIAGDLEEVRWCWENTSVDDALWHFEQSFNSHWGKHLRDLQLYLHATRFSY